MSEPGSEIALRAERVGHAFGQRTVLDGVDLEVTRGELLAVVGANGAGKSTLLRLCLGFVPLERGRVTLFGRALESLSRREVARMAAFVPQGQATDFAFTVREMVAMGRTPHTGRFRPEGKADRDAIARALEATELSAMTDRPFAELSGGERQRVLLARAFAQEAPLLVLDEPNANLDVLHAFQLLALLRARLGEGAAVVAALHDLGLATRFANRIAVLHEGRIEAVGRPADVVTPELLARVFGVRARIDRDDDGRPWVRVLGATDEPPRA